MIVIPAGRHPVAFCPRCRHAPWPADIRTGRPSPDRQEAGRASPLPPWVSARNFGFAHGKGGLTHRRPRQGFTLVEIAVVSLILCLLLSAIVNLVRSSSASFAHQEEAIVCAAEAATLLSVLRRDFEDAVASSAAIDSFSLAGGALSFKDGILQFAVARRGNLQPVQYEFDAKARTVTRHWEGRSVKIGEGLVTDFYTCLCWFDELGIVRSMPPGDRDRVGPEPPLPSPPPRVVKAWVKVQFTMTGRGKEGPPVVQPYTARLFPFRLNRQLTSIWNRPAPK